MNRKEKSKVVHLLRALLLYLFIVPLFHGFTSDRALFATAEAASHTAGPPAITGFWPGNGASGSIVFVFGSGFGASPGANQVTVNGIAAPLVQFISTDLLLFFLPSGNVSGPICITTSLGSTCSALAFGTALSGLNVTGLWSAQGVPGQIVFVFGSDFDPSLGKTQVQLGSTPASLIQVLSPTLLLFVVPPGAVSGFVRVTTLQGSATSLTPFTVLGSAASDSYTGALYMTEGDKTITIPLATATYTRTFWVEGFTDVSGGTPLIGGVTLNANEGGTVNITVYNQTQESHDFEVKGSGVAKVTIAPGGSKLVSFTAPPAGSYIYYDPSTDADTNQAQRAIGMYGTLIIRPAGQLPGAPGNLYSGGPAYKKDYTWVLSDFDKLWNAADKAAAAPSSTIYKATYAFINGDFGSHSLKNLLNSPKSNVGDTIALRIINPGMIAHPIHFHGYHGEVWVKNNVKQTRLVEKDVLDVPPMTTYDLIFHINQKGIYIIHDHTGMMVTQDGIYAEGMLAEFDTCTKEGGLVNACDKFCPIPNIGVPNCGGGGGGWGL